ncbi:segregation/condensation protein A [Nitrospirales bacterium NOB]|nr:MAG: segregation and condensation protein A [Nitrospira sp. OLB3]MBV6469749.1 Segregation and condensation protein A [Nitrospirota bacterium]MCE7966977.1 segregation/condensation protein A [Nitrospira sp. NTP2]MCK6494503.1 segregation/condensation protein A [Nitrospira sp.]MDL1890138.1 segregation/condensation protein A [Nitrospirales bacterium NOB]MEB2339791.1 segregation/condensation protein A [Nitrospirales bacterium]
MDQTELPYQVKIENFEGPLDLLLHLIKKNEINIYDIPIALIARQYLDYLSVMKELNLAVAGEFLVMAATLLHIKSRMLLPVEEATVDEEEGPDPREELVRRLLEYKQFKEAASQLDYKERLWRDVFPRESGPPTDLKKDESLLDEVSLFDLVDALQAVLARHPGKPLIEIIPDNLTVRTRMSAIIEALEAKESMPFTALFEVSSHRLVVIVTFLALLELIRIKVVRVFQAETFGNILVSRAFSAVTEGDVVEDSEWKNL